MPHDKNGNLLKVGDVVFIPCTVTSLTTGEEYCNLNLETVEKMYPGENKSTFVVNSRQALLVSSLEMNEPVSYDLTPLVSAPSLEE